MNTPSESLSPSADASASAPQSIPGHRDVHLHPVRNALLLSAAICATVAGIFFVDGSFRPRDAQAAPVPKPYAAGGYHGAAAVLAVLARESEAWVADESAKGTRPDAAH